MQGSGEGDAGEAGSSGNRRVLDEAVAASVSVSDLDQAASDADQVGSDRDAADAASDQRAADRDQASADQGWQPDASDEYQIARAARDANTRSRRDTQETRSGTSRLRLEATKERLRRASARDEMAHQRDLLDEASDREVDASDAPAEDKARRIRATAVAARLSAADDRERSARDRTSAARAISGLEDEQAVLKEQLRRSQKMEAIGQLAGGIAHEFNNLLTAIRGSASLALDDLQRGRDPREDLELIVQAADRAAGLTRQLLTFARRSVVRPAVVDLGAIVRHLEPMLRRLIGEDVLLVTDTAGSSAGVLSDRGQLEQVIVNLALNARDAMPDGGTLTIATADVQATESFMPGVSGESGGQITYLSVTDTGIGMDATRLAHMFEPFFTTKSPGRGTGLGLATVYGIVRQSGGMVTARSEPGLGSTFTVFLPRVERPATPPVAQASATKGDTEGRKILVVEDDEDVRRIARRMLEAAGYRVITAPNGEGAIAAAEGATVDLLLTDLVMPGMSGREVAARLSSIAPALRVLYMSGHPAQGFVEDAAIASNIHFLAKPFTAETLVAAVNRELTVDRPEQHRG